MFSNGYTTLLQSRKLFHSNATSGRCLSLIRVVRKKRHLHFPFRDRNNFTKKFKVDGSMEERWHHGVPADIGKR